MSQKHEAVTREYGRIFIVLVVGLILFSMPYLVSHEKTGLLYPTLVLFSVLFIVFLFSPSFPPKNSNHWQATMCLPEFS